MKTLQAYRFALDPNNTQAAALARHAGAARFAFNWGLARVKAALGQREAEKTYGIPDAELTEVPWSLYSLRRQWNQAKGDVAPWWAECSKEAYASGLDSLARGLGAFGDSRKGKRKGRRVGFPRFKRRGRRDSFRYTTGAYGPDGDRYVKLPRVGRVKVREPMEKLTSRLADGTARLMGATVSRTAGRWFVSFTVEVDRDVPEPRDGGVVGVDLGVSNLAVLSTGEKVPNPRHLKRSLRKLRKASRAYSRTRPGSRRRTKRAARLARIHGHVADQRRDGLHKLTTWLAKGYGTIVVEDLNVAGMTRSACGTVEAPGRSVRAKAGLNRGVLDAAPGELRRQLAYKTTWYGSRLAVADRWYPSSKTCSACGWRNPSLPLRKRVFACPCGLVMDRDENAAVNLRQLVGAGVAGYPGAQAPNARGADRKTRLGEQVALKREPRTPVGKTGTVPRQRGTAEVSANAH